jgi:hypothetical protein
MLLVSRLVTIYSLATTRYTFTNTSTYYKELLEYTYTSDLYTYR